MNSAMGFSFRSSGVCVMIIRGELAMGASSRRTLHMRVVGVKRALHCLTNSCSRRLIGLRAALWFFSTQINCSPM